MHCKQFLNVKDRRTSTQCNTATFQSKQLTETYRPEDSEKSCSSSNDFDSMSGSCSWTMNNLWSLGDLQHTIFLITIYINRIKFDIINPYRVLLLLDSNLIPMGVRLYQDPYKFIFQYRSNVRIQIEGFWPERCISTIYHAWDTPFWPGTLEIWSEKKHKMNILDNEFKQKNLDY